jgi:HJR/Mrr/RecB family endonuclease
MDRLLHSLPLLLVLLVLIVGGVILVATLSTEWHFRLLDASGLELADGMAEGQFKQYVARYLARRGYRIEELTGETGPAFLAWRRGKATYVRTQRTREGVLLATVQEVVAAARGRNAERVLIATNAGLYRDAEAYARENRVQVWDRPRLMTLLARSGGRSIASRVLEEGPVS